MVYDRFSNFWVLKLQVSYHRWCICIQDETEVGEHIGYSRVENLVSQNNSLLTLV